MVASAGTERPELAEAPPVATNVIEKEAVSFQTASGVGTGAGATSQANQVQGTASTRQTLLNDRQLVGRADAKTMLQSMGVSFPGRRKRNFLAAQRHADRSQHPGQSGHGGCVG